MSGIWSWIYQLALLAAATFVFMVLFAHGPSNFFRNASDEIAQLTNPGAAGGTNLQPSK